MAAVEARDLPWRLDRVEQPHQKRPLWRLCGSAANHGCERRDRWQFGFRIGIKLQSRQSGDRLASDHSFAIPHLVIGAASPALRRDYQRGFLLHIAAFRARQVDAMTQGLIGHGGSGG